MDGVQKNDQKQTSTQESFKHFTKTFVSQNLSHENLLAQYWVPSGRIRF